MARENGNCLVDDATVLSHRMSFICFPLLVRYLHFIGKWLDFSLYLNKNSRHNRSTAQQCHTTGTQTTCVFV